MGALIKVGYVDDRSSMLNINPDSIQVFLHPVSVGVVYHIKSAMCFQKQVFETKLVTRCFCYMEL